MEETDEEDFAQKYGQSVIIVPTLQSLFVFATTLYMICGYVDKKRTGWFTTIIVFLSWYISFSVIVFIPLDIYLSSK